MSILNHLTQFRLALQAQNLRPRTIDSYAKDVKRFEAWFRQDQGALPTLTVITPLNVRDYRDYLHQERGLAPNTINRRLAGLRVFLDWAVDAEYLLINPGAKVKGIEQSPSIPRWLDRDEQSSLRAALTTPVDDASNILRDRAVVLLLLNTGLRVGELLALQIGDLTLSEYAGNLYVREGKGGKSRSVPLNTVARKALGDYLATRPKKQDGAIFLGQQGSIGERTVQRLLKKYVRQAGLDAAEVNVHTLRHTFCKNLVDAGVPLQRVVMLLGHPKSYRAKDVHK